MTVNRSLCLFEVDGVPIQYVTMWSTRLQTMVYVVPQKTGNVPPGSIEVTPSDVKRMESFIADGWPVEDAIYRTLGLRTR